MESGSEPIACSSSSSSSRRVALVTGGAQRVGRVITSTLHKQGYSLVIHCHASRDHALALAASLNSQREDSAHVISADLSKDVAETALQVVREAAGRWGGRLDLLVNNAAQYMATPLTHTTIHHWHQTMDLNLLAPYFLIQAAAPYLRKVRGNVVNVTDILGERPAPSLTVYCTSKAALIMLTKSLALELAPEVRVNHVNPGAAMWPAESGHNFQQEWVSRTPLGRAGTGQEVADAVVFLASPSAAYITGSGISACGGRSISL